MVSLITHGCASMNAELSGIRITEIQNSLR